MSFPAMADFAENLIVGGLAGLTAGVVSGAISRHRDCRPRCRRRGCRCRYRRPVIVEERVYYNRPAIVEQPVVIEERPVIIEERPRIVNDFKDRELALKEQQMQLDFLREENIRKKLVLKEKELALKLIDSK